MNAKLITTLVLVVGLVAPAAGVPALSQSNSPAAADGSVPGPAQAAAASANTDANATNYTRLYVADRYHHLELKPGESDSFEVAVENGEDEPVTVDPHVYVPAVGERPVEKEWVSLDAGNVTLAPGAERTVNVTVSVPEGTELGHYRGWIAFTDETITYPGRPPRPLHAASFNLEVWKEPTVRLLAGEHAWTQVQAGENYTHTVVVENTGEEAVPVNPQLRTERHHRHPGDEHTLQRSWLEIDAPAEIAPGETAEITVTIAPPADADRGDYRAELDLGLKDPARPDRNGYWQRVGLHFQVWKQPDEPFETTFHVAENTSDVALTLSAHDRRRSGDTEPASFDVVFVAPDGTTVDAERARTTTRGHVDLTGDDRRSQDDSAYATGGEEQTFTYRLDDPEAGTWTVRIMPHNAIRFGYEIVRNESAGG